MLQTQEEVENIIIDIFTKVSDEADLDDCDDIITKARVEVEAQSKAVATAYSVTFGEVRVDGEGIACADASASGKPLVQLVFLFVVLWKNSIGQ